MDVAKHWSQWMEQPPEQWLKAADRYVRPALTAVLVLAIAFKLAELTWALLPGEPLDGPEPVVAAPSAPTAARQGEALDVSRVTAAHLFGEAPVAPAEPTETVVEAPETTLSLRLTGVQAFEDNTAGQAIIASGNAVEKAYRVGDPIEGAGAELHAVFSDRVILDRGGRFETLSLPKEPTGGGTQRMTGRPAVQREDPGGSLRQVISENASRITDIIRVVPHLEGGQMVGFRVNPGRNREQFAALGLQPGDVVTDINGTVLDDPTRGLQVFEALGEATQANVTVVRDGTPQVLVIDTSQMAGMAEGRQ